MDSITPAKIARATDSATVATRTLERLVGHRLAAPVEDKQTVADCVTVGALVARARDLVKQQPLLAHFAAHPGIGTRPWAYFERVVLPASVLVRLTVARDRYPALYEHSLRAVFVALFIGISGRMSERELDLLAVAALMHDFGMLHADPAAFAAEGPLDPEARRQLRAHPVTGMLIAQQEPELNPAIATAIAQHHERLDGSGYPAGLPAEQITRLARVLMLVEVVLAMVEHRALPELQLSLVLRLNHRCFDRDFAAAVLAALPRASIPDESAAADSAAIDGLASLLSRWEELRDTGAQGASAEARRFIDERIKRLSRFLAEAGIDLVRDRERAKMVAHDAPTAAELNALMREALWQVRQIASDAMVRWPHLAGRRSAEEADAADAPLRDWLRNANDAPA